MRMTFAHPVAINGGGLTVFDKDILKGAD